MLNDAIKKATELLMKDMDSPDQETRYKAITTILYPILSGLAQESGKRVNEFSEIDKLIENINNNWRNDNG